MSYRKITVARVQYEYVIGREFLKIKDRGIYPVKDIGNPVEGGGFVVGPGNIKRLILGQNPVETFNCSKHNTSTTELTSSPYAAEIHGKIELMPNCKDCVQEDAWEI